MLSLHKLLLALAQRIAEGEVPREEQCRIGCRITTPVQGYLDYKSVTHLSGGSDPHTSHRPDACALE